MKHLCKSLGILIAFGITAVCSGCITAQPCDAYAMSSSKITVTNSTLKREKIGSIECSGGRTTNPLWTSNVGNEEFRTALANSLSVAGVFSAGTGAYRVLAEIVHEEEPLFGFTFNVSEQLRYCMENRRTGHRVFDTTISSVGSASPDDEFVGIHRLRIVKERAIRANIENFLRYLNHNFPSDAHKTRKIK